MTRFILGIAAIYGLLGVILGAFGAHAMSTRLSDDMQAIWHTAVQYQFYHALALLVVGILLRNAPATAWLSVAGLCFVAGTLVFSGSLYALALSGMRILGAITPIGGLLLMAGWVALLVAAMRGSTL